MRAAYFDSAEGGHAPVTVDFFRMHDTPHYLLTISIRASLHGFPGAYPQAFAVVDDFGTLRIVEKWS